MTHRNACFAFLVALTLAAFWAPLSMLIRFSFQQEQYSHIILVPLVSASLLFLERRRIFSRVETCWGAGVGLLFAAALFYWFGQRHSASASENDQLFSAMFPVVVLWVGGFVLCYGLRALRAGLFPVLFLFLMVPIPDFFLNRVIFWLQTGSAEVSDVLFQLAGVPVLRTGFIFALPGVTIEVAKECSGIRSSLALLITSLLAGHLLLRSAWTKAVLTLVTLPLLIVKNGIRIVTLSLLSIYVDPRFLSGSLHRDGGVLFFLLALVLLAPVLRLLQRREQDAVPQRPSFVALVRRAGPSTILRKAAGQTWGTRVFLGLRCDLASLPPLRPATFEVTMRPCDSVTFPGFIDELERVSGLDVIDVFLRQSMAGANVPTLYVATGPDGSPAYVQWLVTARDQHLLHSHQPDRYPTLGPNEVLVEGAYTFCRFRRTGVMANGMAQLLRIAQASGARVAFTYVAAGNAPALRGCANVGFVLDHVRTNKRRLGLRRSVVRPIDEGARQLWFTATSPRAST